MSTATILKWLLLKLSDELADNEPGDLTSDPYKNGYDDGLKTAMAYISDRAVKVGPKEYRRRQKKI